MGKKRLWASNGEEEDLVAAACHRSLAAVVAGRHELLKEMRGGCFQTIQSVKLAIGPSCSAKPVELGSKSGSGPAHPNSRYGCDTTPIAKFSAQFQRPYG